MSKITQCHLWDFNNFIFPVLLQCCYIGHLVVSYRINYVAVVLRRRCWHWCCQCFRDCFPQTTLFSAHTTLQVCIMFKAYRHHCHIHLLCATAAVFTNLTTKNWHEQTIMNLVPKSPITKRGGHKGRASAMHQTHEHYNDKHAAKNKSMHSLNVMLVHYTNGDSGFQNTCTGATALRVCVALH